MSLIEPGQPPSFYDRAHHAAGKKLAFFVQGHAADHLGLGVSEAPFLNVDSQEVWEGYSAYMPEDGASVKSVEAFAYSCCYAGTLLVALRLAPNDGVEKETLDWMIVKTDIDDAKILIGGCENSMPSRPSDLASIASLLRPHQGLEVMLTWKEFDGSPSFVIKHLELRWSDLQRRSLKSFAQTHPSMTWREKTEAAMTGRCDAFPIEMGAYQFQVAKVLRKKVVGKRALGFPNAVQLTLTAFGRCFEKNQITSLRVRHTSYSPRGESDLWGLEPNEIVRCVVYREWLQVGSSSLHFVIRDIEKVAPDSYVPMMALWRNGDTTQADLLKLDASLWVEYYRSGVDVHYNHDCVAGENQILIDDDSGVIENAIKIEIKKEMSKETVVKAEVLADPKLQVIVCSKETGEEPRGIKRPRGEQVASGSRETVRKAVQVDMSLDPYAKVCQEKFNKRQFVSKSTEPGEEEPRGIKRSHEEQHWTAARGARRGVPMPPPPPHATKNVGKSPNDKAVESGVVPMACTCSETERLYVDLAMHEKIKELRSVQRMCCKAVLSENHKNVLVKATMGSGKTHAMVVSIVALQEQRRRAGLPFPLCFIVVKQSEVGSTLVDACMRGLMNHDIYTDFYHSEVFKTWARKTDGGIQDFEEVVDCNFEDKIDKERLAWEISLHQGSAPCLKGRVITADDVLRNDIQKSRLFHGDPKRKGITVQSFDAYRRPVLKKFRQLREHDYGRGVTIIVTYQNLGEILSKYFVVGVIADLVLLDESHSVANNSLSNTWKTDVTRLCQHADRVMMFSGTPITKNGRRDPAEWLERFRSETQTIRLLWTEAQALEAGDIVPCKVVLGTWLQYYNFLRLGERRQKVWSDVFSFYISKFPEGSAPKTPDVDIILTVFLLVRMAVLHTSYCAQPTDPARSPCANMLLMSPNNVVGSVMQDLIHHMKDRADVRLEWFAPLIGLVKDEDLDPIVCSEELQKRLSVCCPNIDKRARRDSIAGMSDWAEDGKYRVLIASKWAFEGTDMPHLHAVTPYPIDKRKDNSFDQTRARPCRTVPQKKNGYLFMLEVQAKVSSEKCKRQTREASSGLEGQESSGPDDEDASSGSVGEVSFGLDEESGLALDYHEDEEKEIQSSEAGPEDLDCKGVGLGFFEAVAKASATGGGILMCPLMMASNLQTYQKFQMNLQKAHRGALLALNLWEECELFGGLMQNTSPVAIVTLYEYKTDRGTNIVAGLLCPQPHKRSQKGVMSDLYIELVEVYERVPSRNEVIATVQLLLDGRRHGFHWEAGQLRCCESDAWHSGCYISVRPEASQTTCAPLRLHDGPSSDPTRLGALPRKVTRAFKSRLSTFDGLPEAFFLGSPVEVLTISQKSPLDVNLAFSTSTSMNVNHLFFSIPIDLAMVQRVPAANHRTIMDRIIFDRVKKTMPQPMCYVSDVVLLALVHFDGDKKYEVVECRPGGRPWAAALSSGTLESQTGISFELKDPYTWQVRDVDILKDTFKVCRKDGRGWVYPAGIDSDGRGILLELDTASTFTRQGIRPLGRGAFHTFELRCGEQKTKSFTLAVGEVPVGVAYKRSRDGCGRFDVPDNRTPTIVCRSRVTQWLCFPHEWLKHGPRVTIRALQTSDAASSGTSPRGYDPSSFDELKHAGKNKVNRFLSGLTLPADGRALLLDDIDPRTDRLRSTDALLKVFKHDSILVLNPSERIVQTATRMGVKGLQKTWSDGLDDASVTTLSLAYYDNCDQNEWAVSEQNLIKVFPRIMPGGVVACTLLRRNFKGQGAPERTLSLKTLMTKNSFDAVMGPDGQDAMIVYSGNLVLFYRKKRE